jgi:hypothetical protein
VFTRSPDGVLSSEGLRLGISAGVDLAPLAGRVAARRVEARELLRLADAVPEGVEPGDSARAAFAVVDLARRSVAEGLVHPYLDHDGGSWFAHWGATLDRNGQELLTQIAAALPEIAATAFDGDREATVLDLYGVVVDRIARDRLRARGVRLAGRGRYGRPSAVESFLDGLVAADPVLPRNSGFPALERRLARWVAEGLGRRPPGGWRLALHLDERPGDGDALALELWLHAEDDPTLGLPAALLRDGGEEIFGFLRAGDPTAR